MCVDKVDLFYCKVGVTHLVQQVPTHSVPYKEDYTSTAKRTVNVAKWQSLSLTFLRSSICPSTRDINLIGAVGIPIVKYITKFDKRLRSSEALLHCIKNNLINLDV